MLNGINISELPPKICNLSHEPLSKSPYLKQLISFQEKGNVFLSFPSSKLLPPQIPPTLIAVPSLLCRDPGTAGIALGRGSPGHCLQLHDIMYSSDTEKLCG